MNFVPYHPLDIYVFLPTARAVRTVPRRPADIEENSNFSVLQSSLKVISEY